MTNVCSPLSTTLQLGTRIVGDEGFPWLSSLLLQVAVHSHQTKQKTNSRKNNKYWLLHTPHPHTCRHNGKHYQQKGGGLKALHSTKLQELQLSQQWGMTTWVLALLAPWQLSPPAHTPLHLWLILSLQFYTSISVSKSVSQWCKPVSILSAIENCRCPSATVVTIATDNTNSKDSGTLHMWIALLA